MSIEDPGPDITPNADRGAVPAETLRGFSHRCSGCGLRWHTTVAGSCAAELCGDCWRKVQPILHGAASAPAVHSAPKSFDPKALEEIRQAILLCDEYNSVREAETTVRERRAAADAGRLEGETGSEETDVGTTGGPLSPVETHHRARLIAVFSSLSLAEVQLLLLGLWIIGEENRVDPRLNTEYGWLLNTLGAQAQGTAGQVLDDQAPSPHPPPAKRQGRGRKKAE